MLYRCTRHILPTPAISRTQNTHVTLTYNDIQVEVTMPLKTMVKSGSADVRINRCRNRIRARVWKRVKIRVRITVRDSV